MRQFFRIGLAAAVLFGGPALAADEVIVIRGTEPAKAQASGAGNAPVVIRGMGYGEGGPAKQMSAPRATVIQAGPTMVAGNALWFLDRDGALVACTLRGSGYVDQYARNVIVCTRDIVN